MLSETQMEIFRVAFSEDNPELVVLTFRVVRGNIDEVSA